MEGKPVPPNPEETYVGQMFTDAPPVLINIDDHKYADMADPRTASADSLLANEVADFGQIGNNRIIASDRERELSILR
jgi:hypothetical protein